MRRSVAPRVPRQPYNELEVLAGIACALILVLCVLYSCVHAVGR